ncbi:MAG: cache domain-containing protein [Candidatus Riflebacteria bacterium]|nr:cache domain-containing protein [Candidatus Riflebacteria bacterium]
MRKVSALLVHAVMAGLFLVGNMNVLLAADPTVEELQKESEARCTETAKDKPTPVIIMEKVDKACELLAKDGAAAFSKFKGKDSDFIFCGTYIWIQSGEGKMLMHPIKPKMDGMDLFSMKDPKGKFLFLEFDKVAKAKGSGWVDYQWPKPGQKEPSPKVSFVKLVKAGDKDMVVGCGVYDMTMEEIEKAKTK